MLVAAALGIIGYKYGLNPVLDKILEDNRSTLYGTLASVSGSLFGFAIAAVSIVLSFISRARFKRLREAASYPQLWHFFISAIWWLGISTIASILALIFDNDTNPVYIVSYVMVFLMIFIALQVATCVWLLQELLRQASRPSIARSGGRKNTSPNSPKE